MLFCFFFLIPERKRTHNNGNHWCLGGQTQTQQLERKISSCLHFCQPLGSDSFLALEKV